MRLRHGPLTRRGTSSQHRMIHGSPRNAPIGRATGKSPGEFVSRNVPIRTETAGLDVIRLDPGGTARVEFLPQRKGRFVFACTLEGHQEAGMQGVLEVK